MYCIYNFIYYLKIKFKKTSENLYLYLCFPAVFLLSFFCSYSLSLNQSLCPSIHAIHISHCQRNNPRQIYIKYILLLTGECFCHVPPASTNSPAHFCSLFDVVVLSGWLPRKLSTLIILQLKITPSSFYFFYFMNSKEQGQVS